MLPGGHNASGRQGEQPAMSGMEHAPPQAVSNVPLALVALLTLIMLGAGISELRPVGNCHEGASLSLSICTRDFSVLRLRQDGGIISCAAALRRRC